MHSDFTFSNDDAHRFMPWHIGVMVALSCLLLSLMLSLGQWAGKQQNNYENTLTIIVPGSTDKLDEKLEQIQVVLKKEEAVEEIKTLGEPELRALLTPWIGKGDALSDVAMPVVLEVQLASALPATFSADELQNKLEKIAVGTELDSGQQWADTFSTFTRIMQWLAGGLAVTVLGVMAFIIMFSARASLHLHACNVGLLHSMGAEDGYIAKQFQMEHFWLGLRGAFPGALVALVIFWLLGVLIARLDAPLLPSFHVGSSHIMLFMLMPIISALIVLFSTRFSVLSELRKVL